MMKDEIDARKSQLIVSFPMLSWEEQLDFIRFSRYHFGRSINEVLQLYVQNPHATVLKSFSEWKDLSKDSSVLRGEEALKIYQGNKTSYFFDVSQTTIAEANQEPQLQLDEVQFLNVLHLGLGQKLQTEGLTAPQFFSQSEDLIRELLAPSIPATSPFTLKENAAAVILAMYHNFNHFGLFLDKASSFQNVIEASLQGALNSLENSENLLRVMNLGNSFARGVQALIEKNFDKVMDLQEEIQVQQTENDISALTEPTLSNFLKEISATLDTYRAEGYVVSGNDDTHFTVGNSEYNGILITTLFHLNLENPEQVEIEFMEVAENTDDFKNSVIEHLMAGFSRPSFEVIEKQMGQAPIYHIRSGFGSSYEHEMFDQVVGHDIQPLQDIISKDLSALSESEMRDESAASELVEENQEALSLQKTESLEIIHERVLLTDLKSGTMVQNGKFRVQDYFSKTLNAKARSNFLKNEYGMGGHSAYSDDGYSEAHGTKGLEFHTRGENENRFLVTWTEVAARIDQLIVNDDYLTERQKEDFKLWQAEHNQVEGNAQLLESSESEEAPSLFDWLDEDLTESPAETVSEPEIQEVMPVVESSPVNDTAQRTDFSFNTLREESLNSFYPTSPTEKVNANLHAIELALQLQNENKLATAFEQEEIAKYVGWGGLANTFFDESNPRFENNREELKSKVTPQEYAQMRASSLTAFYTDPRLIQELYRALSQLGFQGGRVLDPSMGTGNFFASMPNELKENSELYGVELDSMTGLISGQLQQTTNIQVKGFEQTHFAANSMDLVLSNIPFGQIPITDSHFKRSYMVHDYFIKKALTLVHEGGLVAVITSTGTMDKKDSRFRQEISEQANLITAVRLPDNAFSKIAGTDIISDLLIFQKVSKPEKDPEWLETTSLRDDKGNQIFYNQYFAKHPEQVLGSFEIKTFRGGVLSVKADYELEELPYELRAVLENSMKPIYYSKNQSETVFEQFQISGDSLPQEVLNKIEPYTIFVHENILYYHNGEHIEKFQRTSSLTLNQDEKRAAQLKRYEAIKSSIFDEEVNWKFSKTLIGEFSETGVFLLDENEKSDNLVEQLPAEARVQLRDEGKTEWQDQRFVLQGKRIKISEKVSTQYFYHQDYSPKDVQAMKKMIELRQTLQVLLAIQHEENYDTAVYESLREQLNTQYDGFVSEYGTISSQANSLLMRQDDYYEFLASIEEEKEDELTKQPIIVKSAVFFEPTIQPAATAVTVENAEDALFASLNHRGKLDFDYMVDIYRGTKESIIEELGDKLFYVGDGIYQTQEEYLSGDVKTKLVTAKQNQAFNLENQDWARNIEALEEVIPHDIPLSDITYKFGARFIPNHIYQEFLVEALGQRSTEEINLSYDRMSDSYEVKVESRWTDGNRQKYGVLKYEGDHLAMTLLNQREPQITKPDPNDETGKKRVIDEKATADIRAKGDQMKADFKDWVLRHPEVQQEVVSLYNEIYNRSVPKTFDGHSLTVNGLAQQYSLRPHQKNAILRIVQERRAGLFHEVGSGKTLTMLASAMKLKELGIIQKPMYVVPKPLLDQFGREIYKYFPESKVLIAHSEDFSKANRKRFISRIATGKYDAIIIADSQFEKVSVSQGYQLDYMNEQLENAQYLMEHSEKKYTVKKAEQRAKALVERIEKLQKQDVDTFIDFEELGIDMLYVDEAHGYKNLAPMTQLEGVKGISDTRSQKAMDLQQKVQYLHSKFDNAHVVFATGTPISNSVTELYTMMNYLAPDILEKRGNQNFDSWVSAFGNIETVFELTAAGGYRLKRRFTKFGNMPELRNMFREVADIKTAEDLDLPVPMVETFAHQTSTTRAQSSYIDDLIERADKIEAGHVEPWRDNMLKIVGENRKLTLDMRMLDDSTYTEFDSDKLQQVVEEVYKIWKSTLQDHSTQMIFSDLGVPLKYRNSNTQNLGGSINHFSAYDEIKRQLVAKGIPEQEVRFIHEATDQNKESMMRDMRAGKIRVLLASTSKGGTGLNVQDKMIAVHHLDVPWRPSDIVQRNGRLIRQGNENSKVQVHHYITKGSMDAFLWQMQENKLKFVNQVMSGKSDAREMEELGNNEMNPSTFKALSEGDPIKYEYMTLERELKLLTDSRNRYYESKATDEKRIEVQKQKLPLFEQRLAATEKDIEQAQQTQFKPFELSLFYKGQEKCYGVADKKSEIGDQFIQLIRENGSGDKQRVKIAEYRGFEIYHTSQPQENLLAKLDSGDEQIKIIGETEYTLNLPLTSGIGALERINNKIDSLDKDRVATSRELERLNSTIQRIENDRDKPYTKEDEFQEKTKRFKELQSELGFENTKIINLLC